MRRVVFSVLFFLYGLFAWSPALHAEFRCEGQVVFVVESVPVVQEPKVVVSAPSKNPKETPVPPTPAPTPIVSTISFAQIEAKSEDEAKAKAALQKLSGRYLEKAREACRERHENVGGCISAKFEANAAALRSLDFSVRKALEESLRGDCESQRGRCVKAELKEPVCAEIVVAAQASAAPEAEAKKDDKKKAKK
jgi:hypothetical protein